MSIRWNNYNSKNSYDEYLTPDRKLRKEAKVISKILNNYSSKDLASIENNCQSTISSRGINFKVYSADKKAAEEKKWPLDIIPRIIPKTQWNSAIKGIVSSQDNNAGNSIRTLVAAMDKYVFPPEFDCLHNTKVKPVAMYVFEFKYEFDKDDLSYIWQNMAPRDYKKLDFQTSTVTHNLSENELIDGDILNNENLRWMVFKVKQRARTDYYDLLVDQAGEATTQIDNTKPRPREYPLQFNWPYDYLSFVELIKMDVDILFKK